jgi:hypothetical protein
MAEKLNQIAENYYQFRCPGCGLYHAVAVNGHKNSNNASWEWNGSMDHPTFKPSLNVVGFCHSFVTDGKIQFLADSIHVLAGQTVEIPDWED